MKVEDYLPLYGQFYEADYKLYIDGQHIGIREVFENFEEYELNEFQVNELEKFDIFGLQDHLTHEYFTPQTVTYFLRDLFDDYKDSGGEPMYWLGITLNSILLNSGNYKVSIRSEIEKFLLEMMDIYSRIGKEPQKKETHTLSLEDIFSKKTDLEKLVKLLEEKNFIIIENGSPKWTGIESNKARGKKLQLVALSEVCRPLYKLKVYQAKELHKAWTEYFNIKASRVIFQPSKRPPDWSAYHQLFKNALSSISE